MNRPDRSTVFGSLAVALLALSMGDKNFFAPSASAQSSGASDAPQAVAPAPDNAPAQCPVQCSPDGESYVRATADGRLKYARTADGVTLRTFYHCHPRSVAFSPDGQLLACASMSNGRPGRLKVWKLADGALLCQMDTAVGDNSPLCFSPDGHVLASTGPGSRLNLWQLPQGKLKWSATLPRDITRIVFADQGRAVVAICTDGSVTRIPVP
jgi:WD40 repeat protein